MEYRTLGRTGVKVSRLCLGTAMFGAWGNGDHDECIRIVHHALDSGINFIDTADTYSHGEAEDIVGKALANGRRDNVILATKFYGPMGTDINHRGASRRWIMRAVDESLRRLRTDWIDLYQVHRPDQSCDIDETLGALTDLVRAGKVRYLGSSTFSASQIVEAQWTAERRCRERFVCEQVQYSMLVRSAEEEILPVCERYGLGVVTWSPLAKGWLSGDYRKGKPQPRSYRAARLPQRYDVALPDNQKKLEASDALARLAEDAQLTLIQLAIAFILQHHAVTAVDIGPRTMDHLKSQIDAADLKLDVELRARIDRIVPPGRAINYDDWRYESPALS